MIIDDCSYKRNVNGEIINRQKIRVSCDRCGKEKETLQGEYKRRLNKDNDYCRTCSNVLGIIGCRGKKSAGKTKIEVLCEYCHKTTLKYKNIINENDHNFCSLNCNIKYDYEKRYGYLLKNLDNYKNELCYLMGTILGDGTIVDSGKMTKRIAIYCDTGDKGDVEVIKNITNILDDIYIGYFLVNNRSNCRAITFNFPNEVLSFFGMLFSGDKFKAQPRPNKTCTNNINFAVGLFNSDGYFVKRLSSNCRVLSFNNTVKSIIGSLKECLTANNIYCKERERKRKRRGSSNLWKKSYDIWVERQKEIDKIINMAYFKLKKIKTSK